MKVLRVPDVGTYIKCYYVNTSKYITSTAYRTRVPIGTLIKIVVIVISNITTTSIVTIFIFVDLDIFLWHCMLHRAHNKKAAISAALPHCDTLTISAADITDDPMCRRMASQALESKAVAAAVSPVVVTSRSGDCVTRT